MAVFATPDFGASGAIVLFLLLVWAVVLSLVAGGFFWAARLLKGPSRARKACGVFLLVLSGSVPLGCCLGPPHLVRLEYGNYPIGRYPNHIKAGMTAEAVREDLGPPHERYDRNGTETWIYWIDSFSIRWFGVEVGPDGRVLNTYGN